MVKATMLLLMLCAAVFLAAQTTESNPAAAKQRSNKDQITVTGCLAKQSTDYVLIQADQGNSYELERPRKLRLAPYLGQQVEITGTQYPSMSTSSDFVARTGSASPVTIRISTIKTLAKRCSAY